MKTIVFTICILFSTIGITAQDSISGIWNTGKDNTKVELREDNGAYNGTIISSDNAKAKIGNQLLKEITSVDGEWKGKLYNAKKNKWYDAVLKEEGGQLRVTVDAGLVSKTLEWSKE